MFSNLPVRQLNTTGTCIFFSNIHLHVVTPWFPTFAIHSWFLYMLSLPSNRTSSRDAEFSLIQTPLCSAPFMRQRLLASFSIIFLSSYAFFHGVLVLQISQLTSMQMQYMYSVGLIFKYFHSTSTWIFCIMNKFLGCCWIEFLPIHR